MLPGGETKYSSSVTAAFRKISVRMLPSVTMSSRNCNGLSSSTVYIGSTLVVSMCRIRLANVMESRSVSRASLNVCQTVNILKFWVLLLHAYLPSKLTKDNRSSSWMVCSSISILSTAIAGCKWLWCGTIGTFDGYFNSLKSFGGFCTTTRADDSFEQNLLIVWIRCGGEVSLNIFAFLVGSLHIHRILYFLCLLTGSRHKPFAWQHWQLARWTKSTTISIVVWCLT